MQNKIARDMHTSPIHDPFPPSSLPPPSLPHHQLEDVEVNCHEPQMAGKCLKWQGRPQVANLEQGDCPQVGLKRGLGLQPLHPSGDEHELGVPKCSLSRHS